MIILIRHAKVNYKWKSKYTTLDFINANKEYDSAEIEEIDNSRIEKIKEKIPDGFELYTSVLNRSINTAKLLFPDKQIKQLAELSEIPIEPYKNSSKEIFLWKWFFIGRLQWLLNISKQKRNKATVVKEINNILKIIDNNKNTVIVGHGFQFRVMIKKLKKERYSIKKTKQGISNLDVIECIRKSPTTTST